VTEQSQRAGISTVAACRTGSAGSAAAATAEEQATVTAVTAGHSRCPCSTDTAVADQQPGIPTFGTRTRGRIGAVGDEDIHDRDLPGEPNEAVQRLIHTGWAEYGRGQHIRGG
jgi:hypothetical protein